MAVVVSEGGRREVVAHMSVCLSRWEVGEVVAVVVSEGEEGGSCTHVCLSLKAGR